MSVFDGKSDWRTKETHHAYMAVRRIRGENFGCPLCKEVTSVTEFEHWRIVLNDFPYDKVASLHHMLIPKRHITLDEVTPEEQVEFNSIFKTTLNEKYTLIAQALPKKRSIPKHLHYHLLVPKSV